MTVSIFPDVFECALRIALNMRASLESAIAGAGVALCLSGLLTTLGMSNFWFISRHVATLDPVALIAIVGAIAGFILQIATMLAARSRSVGE